MRPLNIVICNERLLPRFGVDRLLVLLARRLVARGHSVHFVCLRCDQPMLDAISDQTTVIDVPAGLDMAQIEAAAGKALTCWRDGRPPDVVVTGGWPFFNAAADAARYGTRSIFIDAGAVAQDRLNEPLLSMQRELRRIRGLTLPTIDRVLPISNYIRIDQTEPDRGSDHGVRTVTLGGDHMALGLFSGGDAGMPADALIGRLDARIAVGEQLLLSLGRFEAEGYKNSPAVYDVLRGVLKQVPKARLLLLDAGADCGIPADLRSHVLPLGAPDDLTLQAVMYRCALGICTSLWEGFNLPIAEMQWIDRPALAFNLGAHPEVTADPWLLCGDVPEMAGKAIDLLRNVQPIDLAPRFAAFRRQHRWDTTLDAWEAEIVALSEEPRRTATAPGMFRAPRRIVAIDVTNSALDPANPGVIRVTRRLCSELQFHPGLEVVFLSWDKHNRRYAFLDGTRRGRLEQYGGPTDGIGVLAETSPAIDGPERFLAAIGVGRMSAPVLFLPEVLLDGQPRARLDWARRHGLRTAALLHDLIPLSHSAFCSRDVVQPFPDYLSGLACVDAIWSVSASTQGAFAEYLQGCGLPGPPSCVPILLPGQLADQPRRGIPPDNTADGEIRILCVATLEPRKNHLRLIEGFRLLRRRKPDLPIRLMLIGNRYAGSPEIAAQVEAATRQDSRIEWHGVVNDERLVAEYEAAAFTAYPSLVEGFGLPIMESLWMGRPCLTHADGVMRELAAGGGCLCVDMRDATAIADGIERLASDHVLANRLRSEAVSRPITTWQDYADVVATHLLQMPTESPE